MACNNVQQSTFFEGAGYYRVRMNKVTDYLATTKEKIK